MTINTLFFRPDTKIVVSTNTFINVPIILKYEETNLIETIRETPINFTSQIRIYHPDGTYLTKAKGNRLFPTPESVKAGVVMEEYLGLTVCKMNGKTLFELRHRTGEYFKTTAELFTNDGCFVKTHDSISLNAISANDPLIIGNCKILGNTFVNTRIGIWVKKDGSISLGVS